jgi:uncharacterized protein (DUF2235 family)
MPRNLVLCCDGTANEFKRDRTNVVKLFYALVHDSADQLTYYHPGVGTMEAIGAVTSVGRKATKLLGLAIGYGLETDIRDAYVFLMRYFQPDDRIFLFGFSRGAYTVRALAAMLHMYGLIRPGNEPQVLYAMRMMMAINKLQAKTGSEKDLKEYFSLASDFKRHFCLDNCAPYFVGVWDTVSSVGWIENPLSLPYTSNPPNIPIGRHAIAIDEKRAFFRTNLWHPKPTGRRAEERQTGLVPGRALRCWRWVSGSRKRVVETGAGLDVAGGQAREIDRRSLKGELRAGPRRFAAACQSRPGRKGARVANGALVAGRIHLEATLRLEDRQKVSAYESVSPAHNSEWCADPRLGLQAGRR